MKHAPINALLCMLYRSPCVTLSGTRFQGERRENGSQTCEDSLIEAKQTHESGRDREKENCDQNDNNQDHIISGLSHRKARTEVRHNSRSTNERLVCDVPIGSVSPLRHKPWFPNLV